MCKRRRLMVYIKCVYTWSISILSGLNPGIKLGISLATGGPVYDDRTPGVTIILKLSYFAVGPRSKTTK